MNDSRQTIFYVIRFPRMLLGWYKENFFFFSESYSKGFFPKILDMAKDSPG